jgi:ApaG protein
MVMYTATTRAITVQVRPQFLAEQSKPAAKEYFWLYTVIIENGGAETVQLLNRHWVITNANGHVEEVQGPGVIGEQPVLGPGENFEYTSGCPLTTPSGIMVGTYEMADIEGTHFDVEIPAFSLDSPYQLRLVN